MYSKRCAACGLPGTADDFTKDRSRQDGLDKYCKSCHSQRRRGYRERNLEQERIRDRDHQRKKRAGTFVRQPKKEDRTRYRIDHDLFLKLQEEQGGLCALCGKAKTQKLVMDHCHLTGVIRGLLCIRCNFALAQLTNDDPNRLDHVRQYMARVVPDEHK